MQPVHLGAGWLRTVPWCVSWGIVVSVSRGSVVSPVRMRGPAPDLGGFVGCGHRPAYGQQACPPLWKRLYLDTLALQVHHL